MLGNRGLRSSQTRQGVVRLSGAGAKHWAPHHGDTGVSPAVSSFTQGVLHHGSQRAVTRAWHRGGGESQEGEAQDGPRS